MKITYQFHENSYILVIYTLLYFHLEQISDSYSYKSASFTAEKLFLVQCMILYQAQVSDTKMRQDKNPNKIRNRMKFNQLDVTFVRYNIELHYVTTESISPCLNQIPEVL